jgi:hypothetical protein
MSVPVAVWNKIEALEQANAELAAKVEELRTLMNARYNAQAAMIVNIKDRASLESPAPAPERVQCPVCGEMVNEESLVTGVWEGEDRCNCPAAEPEPAPLDPVEAIETQAYIYGSSRYWQGVVIKSGEDPSDATSKMLKEWDTLVEMIRAYGRDGAR